MTSGTNWSFICDLIVNPLSLFEEHLFLLVIMSCRKALSFRFARRGTFVLHCVFSFSASLSMLIFWSFLSCS